jgi:hypothetical protein
MAHFAQIIDGVVQQVLVVSNDVATDEVSGGTFLKNIYGVDTIWIQTSYNNSFRQRYAIVGGTYDTLHDVFIAPKPYKSWVLDDNFNWCAPIKQPADGRCVWDEDNQQWCDSQL